MTGDFYFIYAYFYFLVFKSQHKTQKYIYIFLITEPENRNVYKPSKQRKEEDPEDP